MAQPKYKLKGDKKSISYPGFKYEVTEDHLKGEHAENFIAAFKKLDKKFGEGPDGKPKPGYKGFDFYIEEVK